ncbi:MAG TPA: hypothetical protein VK154_18410 [Chitinophagales bacterium]|nr:hypothetical protein [Chitinophagales bacterium]
MEKSLRAVVLFSFLCILQQSIQAQNVGIGTNDPKTKLDVNGGLSLREGPVLTLVTGSNDNVVLPDLSPGIKAGFYRIVGPTGAFSITGIVPVTGADGQMVTLVNTTNYAMTIKNLSVSASANQFKTLTGSDMVGVAGNSSVSIQYNKTDSKWYVTGNQNFAVTTGAIATGDITTANSAIQLTNNTGRLVGTSTMTVDVQTNELNKKGLVPGPTGGNTNQVWGTDNTGAPAWQKVNNTMLNNSSVTINTGTGLSGGGNVALGGTLNLTNTAPDQTVVLSNGAGISATGTYPNFTIANTGDLSNSNEGSLTVGAGTGTTSVISSNTTGSTDVTLEAGTNVTLTETGNKITISSSNSGGTLTSINTGTGLTGGPITTSGTISLGNLGTAGTYNYVTTDAQGRVSAGALRTITGTANQIDVTNGNFSGNPGVGINPSYTADAKASANISGGGNITYNGSGLTWSNRFIVINNGNGSHFSTSGYFDITLPANGTVIPGVGGASNVTVAGGYVPIPCWQALYYILPIGSNNGSIDANFRISTYTAGMAVPENWILIANQNCDHSTVRLGTGQVLQSGQTWPAGAGFAPNTGSGNYVQNQAVTANFGTGQAASYDVTGNAEVGGNMNVGGNVGIGTVSPGAKLQVSAGNSSMALFGPNSSWNGQLYVGAGTNIGAALTAQVISTDGNLHLDPAPSKNMYLGYYQARDMYLNPNGGNVGVGTTSPGFRLHVPSGYIGTDYINTTDNVVGSGVTGIMVKQGDNYHRTGNAAAVLSFLGVTAPTGDNLGNHTATTTLNMAGQNINNVNDILAVNNYGTGLVGVYSDVRYQNVWAMGTSWRLPANGTTPGNLYGLAWTHSNIGGESKSGLSHQLLVMENGVTKVALGSGIWTNYSTYMPIMYDQNNTGYYSDPDGGSRLNTITVNEGYNYGWWRNYNSGQGMYNQATGNHLYAEGNYWNMAKSSGNNGLIFRDGHSGPTLGYVYSDMSGSFGLLSPSGNWRMRVDNSNVEAYGNGFYANTSYLPYVYDRDNTAYYLDPNNWSRSYGIGSFYLRNNYAVSTDHPYGMYFDEGLSTAYSIFRESGGWNYPYPDLRVAFHTGISLGANYNYRGTRIFTDYDMSDLVFAVNDYATGGYHNAYLYGYHYAYNYYYTSTKQVKQDIKKFVKDDYTSVLSYIDDVELNYFRYKDKPGELIKEVQVGLIAEEVPANLADPERKGVSYGALTALNTGAIKAIKDKVETIEKELKNISDFGVEQVSADRITVKFSDEFKQQLNGNKPVVTVTASDYKVALSVNNITAEGFTVETGARNSNATFNWIAMAKIQTQPKTEQKQYNANFAGMLQSCENRKSFNDYAPKPDPELVKIPADKTPGKFQPKNSGYLYIPENAPASSLIKPTRSMPAGNVPLPEINNPKLNSSPAATPVQMPGATSPK